MDLTQRLLGEKLVNYQSIRSWTKKMTIREGSTIGVAIEAKSGKDLRIW